MTSYSVKSLSSQFLNDQGQNMKDLHHHEESKSVIHTVNISDQRMANIKKWWISVGWSKLISNCHYAEYVLILGGHLEHSEDFGWHKKKKKKNKKKKKVLVGEVTASIILDLLYLVLVCYKRLSGSKGIVSRANTGAQGHTITQWFLPTHPFMEV